MTRYKDTSKPHLFALSSICMGVAQLMAGSPALAADKIPESVALPDVEVSGSQPGPAEGTGNAPLKTLRKAAQAGALGSKAEIDTPFSIKTVTSQDLQERQATSLDEALAGDGSVRQASGSTVGTVSYVSVRGLLLDTVNGYKVDGLSYVNRAELPLEMVDQVQILKGLSGFMYGFGSPGGVINYQLKRPTDKPLLDLGVRYQSNGVFTEHADVGGRFGEGDRFGIRVNAAHESGNTYVDNGYVRRDSGSVAMDARLTDSLTAEFDILQSTRLTNGVYYGIFPGTGVAIPTAIDGSTSLAEIGSYYRTQTTLGTAGLKWKINPKWTAKVNYRYGEQYTTWREGSLNLLNNAGNYSIAQSAQIETYTNEQVQASLEGSFQTGPLYHQMTLGLSSTEVIQNRDATPASRTITGGNLYNPVRLYGTSISTVGHYMNKVLDIHERAGFVADTIDLTDTWSVLAGWRYTDFTQDTFDRTTGAKTGNYSASPLTPTYALMYRPSANATFYGSYVESLEKGGAAAIANANYGVIFGPLKSKQYELGAKAQGRNWNATAALFRIGRGAEYTDTNNYFVQSGQLQYDGLELGSEVSLANEWTLSGNAMWLNAKYKDNPALNGNKVPGVSDLQLAARLRYAPLALPGWSFSTGARYYSDYKYDAANTRTVNGYTLFDLGTQYKTRLFGKQTTFNAVINNLTNEKYWVTYSASTPNLMQGAPRTLMLSMNVEFF